MLAALPCPYSGRAIHRGRHSGLHTDSRPSHSPSIPNAVCRSASAFRQPPGSRQPSRPWWYCGRSLSAHCRIHPPSGLRPLLSADSAKPQDCCNDGCHSLSSRRCPDSRRHCANRVSPVRPRYSVRRVCPADLAARPHDSADRCAD